MNSDIEDGQAAERLCARLEAIDCGMLSDVLQASGLTSQVVSSRIRGFSPQPALCGVALCAAGMRLDSPAADGSSRNAYEIDEAISATSVVVVDATGNDFGSVLGGNVGLGWRNAGCRGVVTAGGVRDTRALLETGLEIFAGFVTPLSAKEFWALAGLSPSVTLDAQNGGRVVIFPGDLVRGDDDGLVVLPKAHAETIICWAEILAVKEGEIQDRLRQGQKRKEAYAAVDRFGHISRLAPRP